MSDGARLLVADPPAFFAWATRFMSMGWRSDPSQEYPQYTTRALAWETMADMWNAWHGVEFEEGLQG